MRAPAGAARPVGEWTTWGRTARALPVREAHPATAGDVAAELVGAAREGLRVKAVGSGHSFTPVAVTDGVLLRMDRLSGVVAADPSTGLVRVRAGTPLHRLGAELDALGLAMTNLGDIDRQTISGAVSTGTHGTGARFGGLATQVVAAQVVLPDGSVVDCSPAHEPELFAVARLGLGAFGVLTELTVQCVPAFDLHAREEPGRLDDVLERLDDLVDGSDHCEFYWFPHTDRVQLKVNTRLPAGSATPDGRARRLRRWVDDEVLSNAVFAATNRLCAGAPGAVPTVNAVAARALTAREYTAPSPQVFTAPRRVRFRESEYAVPRESVADVVTELRRAVDASALRVSFPVEVRFAAADDVWLSTAHGRESAYVAVHQHVLGEHEEYVALFERVVRDVGGRPHWGKLHSMDAASLAPLYPRFADALAVRDRVDPGRVLGNAYLSRVLGP
ncbi:D-arabinono-1,4-lactone oxidase [Thalassiella azotivora]